MTAELRRGTSERQEMVGLTADAAAKIYYGLAALSGYSRFLQRNAM